VRLVIQESQQRVGCLPKPAALQQFAKRDNNSLINRVEFQGRGVSRGAVPKSFASGTLHNATFRSCNENFIGDPTASLLEHESAG
jgi:hypothetical protein